MNMYSICTYIYTVIIDTFDSSDNTFHVLKKQALT